MLRTVASLVLLVPVLSCTPARTPLPPPSPERLAELGELSEASGHIHHQLGKHAMSEVPVFFKRWKKKGVCMVRSDREGRYHLEDLPLGRYEVEVHHQASAAKATLELLQEGHPVVLDIQVDPRADEPTTMSLDDQRHGDCRHKANPDEYKEKDSVFDPGRRGLIP